MRYIFLFLVLLSCNNVPRKVIPPHVEKSPISTVSIRRDTSTIDIHDPYQTGKDTVRLNAVMDKIFKFPEIQTINRQIIKSTKGAHGVSIMVSDEFDGDTAYYDFRVGDNSDGEMYHNIFDFILEKKTGQIKVYDTVSDSIISLKDWRKTRR
jgi:hypothetical protein